MVYYEPIPASDGTSLTAPSNAEFRVFEVDDIARVNPLELRTVSGLNAAPLVTTAQGVLPGVEVVSSNFSHIFKSGEWEWRRDSVEGIRKAAVEAQASATEAVSLVKMPTDQAVDAGITRADIPQTVAKTVAAQPTVVTAAAAAVDANPKIAELVGGVSASVKRRGLVPNGSDFNNFKGPAYEGLWEVNTSTQAASMVNGPDTGGFGYTLEVRANSNGITSHTAVSYGTGFGVNVRATGNASGTTWLPWKKVAFNDGSFVAWTKPSPAVGTNMNTVTTPGLYPISTATLAESLVNGAPSKLPGFYEVLASPNGIVNQRFVEYQTNRKLERITIAVQAGTFTEWKQTFPMVVDTTPVATAADSGLSNAVLIGDFTQKMGGRKKVTTATVAFRFDHGLANFNAHARPEMEARMFKYSLALCSGQWERAENAGVTAQMVNGWVVGGLAEIWNHSKDHGSGDNSEAGWKAAILDGLTELQTQIPAAAGKIFGFAPPGSTGTNFGGFTFGQSLDEFHNTDGGRFILSKHAVTAGYLYTKRVQDGMVRQGAGHITIDTYTRAQVQTHVEQAKAGKTALQIMLHPSRLNTEGYMTTSEFVSILDYVKAEEAAGRLEVVSPYEQLLTDAV